jgi:hypothetical protein
MLLATCEAIHKLLVCSCLQIAASVMISAKEAPEVPDTSSQLCCGKR